MRHIKENSSSDRTYFNIDKEICKYKENGLIGKRIGTAVKPEYTKITQYNTHALSRMFERYFGTEDAQSYVNNAVVAFSQGKGQKAAYYSPTGVSAVDLQTGELLTGWNSTDFDEKTDLILKVAKKYARRK